MVSFRCQVVIAQVKRFQWMNIIWKLQRRLHIVSDVWAAHLVIIVIIIRVVND